MVDHRKSFLTVAIFAMLSSVSGYNVHPIVTRTRDAVVIDFAGGGYAPDPRFITAPAFNPYAMAQQTFYGGLYDFKMLPITPLDAPSFRHFALAKPWRQSASKQSVQCGRGPIAMPASRFSISERIAGGTNSKKNDWPFMVVLKKGDVIFCAGTLISDTKVLLAAQCLEKMSAFEISDVTVLVGMYQVNPPDVQMTRRVAKVVIHSQYNSFTYANDIAMVTLDMPVVFSKTVGPVCLPPSNTDRDQYVDQDAIILGWGGSTAGLGVIFEGPVVESGSPQTGPGTTTDPVVGTVAGGSVNINGPGTTAGTATDGSSSGPSTGSDPITDSNHNSASSVSGSGTFGTINGPSTDAGTMTTTTSTVTEPSKPTTSGPITEAGTGTDKPSTGTVSAGTTGTINGPSTDAGSMTASTTISVIESNKPTTVPGAGTINVSSLGTITGTDSGSSAGPVSVTGTDSVHLPSTGSETDSESGSSGTINGPSTEAGTINGPSTEAGTMTSSFTGPIFTSGAGTGTVVPVGVTVASAGSGVNQGPSTEAGPITTDGVNKPSTGTVSAGSGTTGTSNGPNAVTMTPWTTVSVTKPGTVAGSATSTEAGTTTGTTVGGIVPGSGNIATTVRPDTQGFGIGNFRPIVVAGHKNFPPATSRTSLAPPNPLLQQVKVTILSNFDCRADSLIGRFVSDKTLCITSPTAFTCKADVGGPVLINSAPNVQGTAAVWTLAGINSYTQDCNSNGLKTRVSAYRAWIDLYMN